MNKKRVAIIGTVGVPAAYGGFETLAEHLVKELNERYELHVYCSSKKYNSPDRPKSYNNARLHYIPLDANGIQSIPYDILSMIHALFYADVFIVLGVSGGIFLPFVKWFTRKKIIVSIDGIEWKRGKWSRMARWYLWFAEGIAVRNSHADIADNESIQDYTAMRYKSLSNIIEYGADHTIKVSPEASDYAEFPFLKQKYAFKVCRIEPENNVHVVLKAFSMAKQHKLVFVGNWDKSEYGRALREQYQSESNILLLDPIYDHRKLDLLRGNASLYIHGHSAGGTNPSLVEAMYLHLPVLAFDVMYNRTTTQDCAAYFKNWSELYQQLEDLTSEQLQHNANVMKQIADSRYTWKIIADKYNAMIEACYLKRSSKNLNSRISYKLDRATLTKAQMGHLAHASFFYEKR
jgi:glycosyltransferase involved in cell wall biosynthesis